MLSVILPPVIAVNVNLAISAINDALSSLLSITAFYCPTDKDETKFLKLYVLAVTVTVDTSSADS